MKPGIKNLIKSVLFLAIFCVGLAGLYNVYKWKDTNGDYLSTFDSLYSFDEDVVDVVFAGPSYTYQTMNPAQYWEDYGIAAFTMSISGQDKNSTVASLREVLKTQSPDIIMVDASGSLFDEHAVKGNVYRNTISMKLSPNSVNLVNKSIKPEERLDYLLRWPIVHTRYRELKKYDFVQYKPSIYSMGFNYVFNVVPREASLDVFTITDSLELSDTNRAWIDELESLAQENNATLIFYLTPGVADGDGRRTINGVAEYLNEKNIKFLDLDKTMLAREIDYSNDFADYRHLNYWGSLKQVRYIAEFLQENYQVADHRGQSGYGAWDNAVRYRKSAVSENTVFNQWDAVSNAQAIAEMDNLAVVVALEGDYANASSSIFDALEILGLNPQNAQAGETWVIENGVVTYDSVEIGTYKTKVNNSEVMEVNMQIGGLGQYVTSVSVGTDYYRADVNNINGMYIFVYDKIAEKYILSGYYY